MPSKRRRTLDRNPSSRFEMWNRKMDGKTYAAILERVKPLAAPKFAHYQAVHEMLISVVKEVLAKYGIEVFQTQGYVWFAQGIWYAVSRFRGEALYREAVAHYLYYSVLGLNENALREIAARLGVDLPSLQEVIAEMGLGARAATYNHVSEEDKPVYGTTPYVVDEAKPDPGYRQFIYIEKVRVYGHNRTFARYHREVTVKNNAATDIHDYAVPIILDSSNFDFSKAQPDGSDVFFTDLDGNPLYYWIEKWDAENQWALLWVKVPFVPAGGETKILMLYGGANRFPEYRDPKNVFIFFDNFEVWEGWFNVLSGAVQQDDSYAYDGKYALNKINNCDPNGGAKNIGVTLGRENIALMYRALRPEGAGTDCYADRIGLEDDNGNGYSFNLSHGSNPYIAIDYRSGGNPTVYSSVTLPHDYLSTWYVAELIITPDKVIAKLRDEKFNLVATTSLNNTDWNTFTRVVVRGGRPYWVDVMRIRKVVDPEPTVTIGSERYVGLSTYVDVKIAFDDGSEASIYTHEIVENETLDVTLTQFYDMLPSGKKPVAVRLYAWNNAPPTPGVETLVRLAQVSGVQG